MKLTPLEIRNYQLKTSFKGYDRKEADGLRELSAATLEEAILEIHELESKLRETTRQLNEHIANERVLKESITSAQRISEDMKKAAEKEAQLLIAEARMKADEIVRQAHARASSIQDDIYRLRQKRLEMQSSIKAIIDYHSTSLLLEEDEAKKDDEEAEKLKYLAK